MSHTFSPDDISRIVKNDLERIKSDCTNGKIRNCLEPLEELQKQLIKPEKRQFVVSDTFESISSAKKVKRDLWVVLEDVSSGYRIIYDVDKNAYGLAFRSNDGEESYIGTNGNLLYVFKAM